MLTREEADSLYLEVMRKIEYDVPTPVFQIIDKYVITEKPKRAIQVGDIYRCNSGRLHEIQKIDESQIETSIDFYNLDGTYYGDGTEDPDCKQDDLDLSKRYKLVEVKDE